jgi:hypothetical protein
MLPRNRSLNSEGFSLKFVLNVVEGTQYPHPVAESAEGVSLG